MFCLSFFQLTLNESIRYAPGDAVEKWLTDLLCLDATNVQPILSGCPPPDQCDLYYINRYFALAPTNEDRQSRHNHKNKLGKRKKKGAKK